MIFYKNLIQFCKIFDKNPILKQTKDKKIYKMSIKAGLVGLPNVGKSTLFNALTKSSVPAENYPFCTIDPHVAITHVPDSRLQKLKDAFKSEKIIPSTVSFVDIAGLVKGAASGEGLGNQFLSHIREVDLVLHVLRCFEDEDIIHTMNDISPLDDYEIIVEELMLKDLESVEKRIEKLKKSEKALANDKQKLAESKQELELLEDIKNAIDNIDAQKIRNLIANNKVETVPLLTAKNFLIIANLSEHEIDDYANNKFYKELIAKFGGDRIIPISAKIEFELSQLNEEEAQDMMSLIGIKQRGLDNIIKKSYHNLGLITFFTCGPKEIHAWPIKKNTRIRDAAGEIHSDLQKGFICAEVYNCEDLFKSGAFGALKESGKLRTEGQDYIVQDGDIVNIRFNV